MIAAMKIITFLFLLALPSSGLLARGGQESATAEGGEIWGHEFDITARRDGRYNYIVYAGDRAGNESISGPFNIRINANAGLPTARVIYPENNSVIRRNINALGIAHGRFGVERVMIRLNNNEWVETLGNEYWNNVMDFSGLPDGMHSISVQAFDDIGTTGPVQTINFYFDTTPPDIAITSHQVGDILNGTVTVRGTANDANGIKSLEYSDDGENFTSLSVGNRGDFSIKLRTGRKPNGPLVFFIRAVDNTGLASVLPCLFFVENRRPGTGVSNQAAVTVFPENDLTPDPSGTTLIINSPIDGEVITRSFDISGIAFDNAGIRSVYWRLLGPKLESISPGAAGREAREAAQAFLSGPDIPFIEFATNRRFNIPVDFSTLTDGEYTLEMYTADSSGTRSRTNTRTINVSTSPPESRVMAPVITRYNRGAIMVRGFASDANGIQSVTISMDNNNTWQNAILHDNGSWELPLNTIMYNDGTHSMLIRTIDNYGIESFSNAMINIDNTPPELYMSSPQNGESVGTIMYMAGRISDNIHLRNITFQIISAENPSYQRSFEIPAQLVIFEEMNLIGFPRGEYILRVMARDFADNETVVSRRIIYDADDDNAQIAIFNPMPGDFHTGPIDLTGIISGTFLPDVVDVMLNGQVLGRAPVDRYGVFYYQIPESFLGVEESHRISAVFFSHTGKVISSPVHTVHYNLYGPALQVESHLDSNYITRRPWMAGRAWIATPEYNLDRRLSRELRESLTVRHVEFSYDNGRSFQKASGGSEWRFRLETGILPSGPQPVLIRAVFGNGEEAVTRILLNVDTTPPLVEALFPLERSSHRENLPVFGIATDDIGLADVDVVLRPFHKFWYSIPPWLRGAYFDLKFFGATYFDIGAGLSLFDDNVRFQFQWGYAPPAGAISHNFTTAGGRYTGHVLGIKLLANIFYLPFDYMFGPDWGFYSMNVAVGANFSFFGMSDVPYVTKDERPHVYIGAVVGQWDIASIDMQYFYPEWKYFRRFSLYISPELWFTFSDDRTAPKTVFRPWVFGIRVNWF
ncbi:MAG: Ig-like domain-containing protein [Treponema sp.]|nr:Ig-like domain-containing protein [Treponema sp.]